jgi:hypothetical protein
MRFFIFFSPKSKVDRRLVLYFGRIPSPPLGGFRVGPFRGTVPNKLWTAPPIGGAPFRPLTRCRRDSGKRKKGAGGRAP